MAPRSNDADEARQRRANDLYRYAGTGIQFAATLGVFGGAGYFLDLRLGTLPLFLLLGILAGFALATYSLVRRFGRTESKVRPDGRTDPKARPSGRTDPKARPSGRTESTTPAPGSHEDPLRDPAEPGPPKI